jgi:hypothetical protein
MKLYTQQQLETAIMTAYIATINEPIEIEVVFSVVMNELTPIELPTDEEIEEYVDSAGYWGGWSPQYFEGIIEGAKWMRDKIQGGNNEQQ